MVLETESLVNCGPAHLVFGHDSGVTGGSQAEEAVQAGKKTSRGHEEANHED